MFRNFLATVTLIVCFTFFCGMIGCGGPGEVQQGKASNSNFGKGVGQTDDGEDLPDGLVVFDD